MFGCFLAFQLCCFLGNCSLGLGIAGFLNNGNLRCG
nr:MAG TPA_asm: hypothetical protein [Caudoviricetes sp.]